MTFQTGTDLAEIKKLAKCFLYLEPEETEFSPMIVHHPFTSSGFVCLRDDAGDVQIGNILEKEDDSGFTSHGANGNQITQAG